MEELIYKQNKVKAYKINKVRIICMMLKYEITLDDSTMIIIDHIVSRKGIPKAGDYYIVENSRAFVESEEYIIKMFTISI